MITLLIVYVDGMVFTKNDLREREVLKKYLSSEFEIKILAN